MGTSVTIVGAPATPGELPGDYIDSADIYAVFGESNVGKWADLDNDADSVKIAARVNNAILWAENEINSRLRNSAYVLPLANADDEVPAEIVDVAANLAGVWLYENRGVQDYNPDTGQVVHRLRWNRDRAEKTLREILAGVRVVDAVQYTVTRVPAAIANE